MQIKPRKKVIDFLKALCLIDFLHALCPFFKADLIFFSEPKYSVQAIKHNDVKKYETFHLKSGPRITFSLTLCAFLWEGVTYLSIQLLTGSFSSHRQPFPWQFISQPFNFYTGEQKQLE